MTEQAQYRWYMAGVVTFVVPLGIQMVLFPWLIAVELQLDAEKLGWAQMTMQIPPLCLVLFGGLLADRVDARKVVAVAHCCAAVPALLLAWLVQSEQLAYGWMLLYALMMGCVVAFVQPARDSLLNRIAGDNLQRTVTVAMGLTFGAQIFGFAAASTAETIGAPVLLLGQATIMLLGAYASMRLVPVVSQRASSGNSIRQIKDGLQVVWASSEMRGSMVLLAFMGLFYGGAFMVLNPLVVRDIYDGGAREISLSFGAFMGGTIITTVALVTMGGLSHPGRGLLFAVVIGGFVLLLTTLELPFWGYLLAIFGWGICGGVAMSMGRTIMQTSAPEAYRARVMSVFTFANAIGAPFGALLMGYLATHFGPLNSFLFAVGGIWLTAIAVSLTTDVAKLATATDSNT